MNQKINHISNFGALGGVQSYLMGLKKFSKNDISLYSTRKPISIYSKECSGNNISLFNLFDISLIRKSELFVIHNLILAKSWQILEKSQKIFKKTLIYHEHGCAWHAPEKDISKYKKRISKVDCIIVNSNATANLLNKIYQIKQEINILRSPIFIYEDDFKTPLEN